VGRDELVAELKAIEKWDYEFYRSDARSRDAVASFLARQSRRAEIIEALRAIIRSPSDDDGKSSAA
jgi:hypothetical protein